MSAQYLLPCTCGQEVRVGNAQAGQEVLCTCGNRLSVPTLRGLRDLKPAPADPAASKPKATWSRSQGVAFAVGLTLVALGLAYIAFQFFTYSQVIGFTEDQSGHVVAHEEEFIDDLSPIEMLEAWEATQTEGLGQRQLPYWVIFQRVAESSLWRAGIAGGFTLLGIVLIVGALLAGRGGEFLGKAAK